MSINILLISTYELGHQPLSLAAPLAALRQAGFAARPLDLARETPSPALIASAQLIALATPMHTALRLGVDFAAQARALNPSAHLCFFGLYAWLNQTYLLDQHADSIIGGEYELPLIELARALTAGRAPSGVTGLSTRDTAAPPNLARAALPIPARETLPALTHYAHYIHAAETPRLAGYTEATRGCLHTCTHCPIVPIYHGRFFVLPVETVLADIRQQIAQGAEHLTFGDPDFLNGPTHALRLARALHAEFPHITFDFTTKIEHILKHADLFPELAALGCTFVTSAIESLSDQVLAQLNKGHTAADIDTALEILDSAQIALHPTLVAFTPWTTLADYLALTDFIYTHGLAHHLAPVQLSIRLLVPPNSLLLTAPNAALWLGPLDSAAFTHHWAHPDPRMDVLQREVAALVAEAEQHGKPAPATHAALRALAYAQAGQPLPTTLARLRPAPPRLTENWFC